MFYIRGPQGAGKVYSEMFKDEEGKAWKLIYLIVDMTSSSPYLSHVGILYAGLACSSLGATY
jgi:hypothetical protein